jgi:ABC-type Zn uptake system ZnuABC Zn-binding protein ZnuA
MKKLTLALVLMIAVTACGQNTKKAVSNTENNVVNVYYFHGKTRCATCIAVGDVVKKTVETAFAGNKKVVFTEINVSDKANEALAEKYEVTWNALIIAKGDSSVDITQQAFATALENPQTLENLIKEEVNKRLK